MIMAKLTHDSMHTTHDESYELDLQTFATFGNFCYNMLCQEDRVVTTQGKEQTMGVENIGETYRCNVCGNEVSVTKVGGGELVCCNQPMERVSG